MEGEEKYAELKLTMNAFIEKYVTKDRQRKQKQVNEKQKKAVK